jgi:tetratricopeptide (TPR) repeat protein
LLQNLADLKHAAAPPAEDRFNRGAMLAASGNLEDAAIEFQACVALAPDSVPARFNLGGVFRRLGRNGEAIEQLEIARGLAPGDASVSIELGLAYVATGENDQALEAFKRAVALDPDSPESKLHLPELIRELERSGPLPDPRD